MRVLFLESHPMWIYGLPYGFCDAGHQVLVSGPLTEHNISEMIADFQPDLIFTMGCTPENDSKIKQKWINESVKDAQIPHVYWATEDPRYTLTFSLPLIRTLQPDFVFTICPSRVYYYNQLGIKADRLDFGYHSNIHYPVDSDAKYRCYIALVANAYPMLYKDAPEHTRYKYLTILIGSLLDENIRVDLWGRYWDEMGSLLGWDIPQNWIHGYLPYIEGNKVYSSADIILGIQNLPTQLTQRTYEILGSGGFLLTLDTPEIRNSFQPDHDLIVTSSTDKTLQQVWHYLEHPDQRKLIQEQGRSTVAKYSYQHRAEYIINALLENQILNRSISSIGRKGEISHYIEGIKDEYEVYFIQKGDTLWAISQRLGVSINKIWKLNGLTSDLIFPGQYLKVRER